MDNFLTYRQRQSLYYLAQNYPISVIARKLSIPESEIQFWLDSSVDFNAELMAQKRRLVDQEDRFQLQPMAKIVDERRLEVFYSKKEIFGFGVFSLITLGSLPAFVCAFSVSDDPFFPVIVLLGLIPGLIFIVWSMWVSEQKPRLSISNLGIAVKGWKWGTVPWEDIEAMWIGWSRTPTNRLIFIHLKNPEKYYTQMSILEKMDFKMLNWSHKAHLTLEFALCNRNIDEVWAYISGLNTTGEMSVRLSAPEKNVTIFG